MERIRIDNNAVGRAGEGTLTGAVAGLVEAGFIDGTGWPKIVGAEERYIRSGGRR